MSGRSTRAVYVGPVQDPVISAAVRDAGARTVDDPAQADTLVWLAHAADELAAVLHPGVSWVQLKAAGVDSWIASGLIDDERVWTGARGAYAEAVAEHGLTLMLAAARRLHEIIPDRTWGEPGTKFGRLVAGSTVGIVGCGAIGRALIDLLTPLRVRVLAVTRRGEPVSGAAQTFRDAQVDEVLPEADFVVLTAPSTPETHGMIDARRLGLMRADSWLVNIGRGPLVDTDALVRALEDGVIGGAALDVTDPEPLPDDHPLWSAPNALITPHTANPPAVNSATLAERTVENIRRLERGEPPLGLIDVDAGY